MGALLSTPEAQRAKAIRDKYETMEQFSQALRAAGLEKCNMLVAIDFTKSNTWQGAKTFDGRSLHHINSYRPVTYQSVSAPSAPEELNPYQYVLKVAGAQLDKFDDDGNIPTIIFGHARAPNENYIREINCRLNTPCFKMNEVLQAYEFAAQHCEMSGGTRFSPVIDWAANIAHITGEYHILLIIGDGCIEDLHETRLALARACQTPLSIVFVGVGDGSDPNDSDKWKSMRVLDDHPTGAVDNWQSVYLANIQKVLDKSRHPDVDLAVNMFMEIPDQYLYFKRNGLIRN